MKYSLSNNQEVEPQFASGPLGFVSNIAVDAKLAKTVGAIVVALKAVFNLCLKERVSERERESERESPRCHLRF